MQSLQLSSLQSANTFTLKPAAAYHWCAHPRIIVGISMTSKHIGHSVMSSSARFARTPSAKTAWGAPLSSLVKFLTRSSRLTVGLSRGWAFESPLESSFSIAKLGCNTARRNLLKCETVGWKVSYTSTYFINMANIWV